MNEGDDPEDDGRFLVSATLSEEEENEKDLPAPPKRVPSSSKMTQAVIFDGGNWVDSTTGKVIDSPRPPSVVVDDDTNSKLRNERIRNEVSIALDVTTHSPMGFSEFILKEEPVTSSDNNVPVASSSASDDADRKKPQKMAETDFTSRWTTYVEEAKKTADSSAKAWLDMEVKSYFNAIATHNEYRASRCAEVASHIIDTLFRLFLALGNKNNESQRMRYTNLTQNVTNHMKRAIDNLVVAKTKMDKLTRENLSKVDGNAGFLQAVALSDYEKAYIAAKIGGALPMGTVYASFCNIAVRDGRDISATLLAYSLYCICKVVDLCTDPELVDTVPDTKTVTEAMVVICHQLMDSILFQRIAGGDKGIVDEAQALSSLHAPRPRPPLLASSSNRDSSIVSSIHRQQQQQQQTSGGCTIS